MKPYYKNQSVTIYHGDCRQIVPQLGSFDLLLTDPPYGLGKKLQGGSWGKKYEGNNIDWDAAAPDLDFVIPHGHKCIIWGGNYFFLLPSRRWLVWSKPNALPSAADCELAWCSWDGNAQVFTKTTNPDGKRQHPTQKPLVLMQWCINLAGNVQTILDQVSLSGTTGRASKDWASPAVLIDMCEQHSESAAPRMAQEVLL